MGVKKVTKMVLKVDLQCTKCYRKVKKVLCKFPQIQDQVFDEKSNTVTIKVVCCSPEKIRDKICCKGGASIKSIEIVPEKPKQPEKPEKPKQPEKPKEPEKPKQPEKPKDPEKPKEPEKQPKPPEKPKVTFVEPPPQPKAPGPVPMAPGPAPMAPGPAPGCPQPQPYIIGSCCTECYNGRPGGPCNQICYGEPVRCYDSGYYGRPVYDSWGGGGGDYRPCYAVRSCGQCFSDDNPSACAIM